VLSPPGGTDGVIDLRPVRPEDRELLWRIQCTSMRPPVEATWGWDEAVQRAFLQASLGDASRRIVRVDGTDAGVLSVETGPDHVFLKTVALLPEFLGRGIGTRVVQRVVDEAAALGLPVRLQVLKPNRARRLYERLGFREYAQTATHVLMVRERGAG